MRAENIRIFPDIDSRAWEHPADRAALSALEQMSGLNVLVENLIGSTSEKSLRLFFLASSIKVTERQFPKVYEMIREACRVLDVSEIPDVYVMQTPLLNAFTLGVRKPFIVLNSALIQSLSEDELLGVIAHELGHVASGHAKYKTVLWLLVQVTAAAGATLSIGGPISELLLNAVVMALREWDRKSELSADRAELLVLQNPAVSYSLLMKLAGGSMVDQMNIDDFFTQADEYSKGGDILDNVFKVLNLMGQSHPFPVLRLAELKKWVESGAYEKILGGDYPGRGRKDRKMEDEFRSAASSYQHEFEDATRSFQSAFSSLGKDAEKFGKDIEAFFKGMFGK